MAKSGNSLPIGTKIDTYVIDKVLGGGGFSIVYLALDKKINQKVVIKEYMPRKIAHRIDGLKVVAVNEQTKDTYVQGRKLFFKEASTLSSLKHPNIVNVINFFQANGTVYMVMDYEEGANLQSYIKFHHGNLSEKFIRTVFPQLLGGLKVIHSHGLLHLDIKPGNIHLRSGGRPLLLDFGSVHSMRSSRKFQPSQIITPGFSPIEQYDISGYVGPWSDIYAIGATMRACIEGMPPPSADRRKEKDSMRPAVAAFKRRYSVPLLKAIDWAMDVDPVCRPQSIDDYLAALEIEPTPEEEEESANVIDKLVSNFPWIK